MRLDPFSEEADRRMAQAHQMLAACYVCPRSCGTARLAGEIGVCRADVQVRVASWNLHHGEEPPISGVAGSGTIFLSGCSLRCSYCQNYPISQQNVGEVVSIEELVAIMLKLQARNAININFVTPTHYGPQLLEAIILARRQGLTIPIVWNTSGYEQVEMLRLLDGVVDIYLADMRYGDDKIGQKYSKARDYWSVNTSAIKEMYRQVGDLVLDDNGIAVSGLLVRHLVLPHGLSRSERVFAFIANEVSPRTSVSLMSQYFPAHQAVDSSELGRRLTPSEYEAATDAFDRAGLSNGFMQELP